MSRVSRPTGVLIALLLLLLGGEALAATMAVLPLAEGTTGQSYEGMGKALAGMLVSDLSTVPSLELVERERLDALLAELELGESAFVDPASAVELGHGLGAGYVLLGSYSVVEQTFTLDGRIVEVDSGRIVKAAAASGPVADFVSVEKDLVEGLLEGLEVSLSTAERRRLYLSAPTESFDAMAAFGEGLARRDEGRTDAARVAFERAVALDPEFAEAREALAGIRTLLEEERTSRIDRSSDRQRAAHQSILAEVPDERTRPADHQDDARSIAAFAARLMVLQDREEHCHRHDEMLHYLDRVDWRVEPPEPLPDEGGVYGYLLGRFAEAHDYRALPHDVPGPEAAHVSPVQRASRLWRSTADFIVDGADRGASKPTAGLLDALLGCFPPEEQLDQLDRLRHQALDHGVLGQVQQRNPTSSFTLGESLDIVRARIQARTFGADADLEQRLRVLLERREAEDPVRRGLERAIEDIGKLADTWDAHRARRRGIPPEELVALQRAVVDGDPARIRTDGPYCAFAVQTEQGRARDWVLDYDDRVARGEDVDSALDRAGITSGLLRDLGCVVAEEGRFDHVDQVFAWVESTPERLRPGAQDERVCSQGLHTLLDQAALFRGQPAYPGSEPSQAWALLSFYWWGLVYHRCVDEQRGRVPGAGG